MIPGPGPSPNHRSATPELTFFCELDAAALASLFATPGLEERLRALHARVSLGILDLSAERAAVVRRLNEVSIPVIAWQLLPKEQGYWFSLCNSREAAERYQAFRAWSQCEGLHWTGIGIDIEPHFGELQLLLSRPLGFVRAALKRGCSKRRYEQARSDYQRLVAEMRADGFRVEAYELPLMIEETRSGSTLIQRLLGVPHVPTDRRVLLTYSSFFRPLGSALVWSYARSGNSIGVGVTGGGVQIPGYANPPPLSWEELLADLASARRSGRPIYIFSLEGCHEQGFLERLQREDWTGTAPRPVPWGRVVSGARGLLQACLWLFARPWVALPLLLAPVIFLTR